MELQRAREVEGKVMLLTDSPSLYQYVDVVRGFEERVAELVMHDFNLTTVFYAASMLTRLRPPSTGGDEEGASLPSGYALGYASGYSKPHVDKANVMYYDYSAVLYLNSGTMTDKRGRTKTHFEGGELVFLDKEDDVVVTPQAGRLVTFSGGLENLHSVRPVTTGSRMALLMWFSCKKWE